MEPPPPHYRPGYHVPSSYDHRPLPGYHHMPPPHHMAPPGALPPHMGPPGSYPPPHGYPPYREPPPMPRPAYYPPAAPLPGPGPAAHGPAPMAVHPPAAAGPPPAAVPPHPADFAKEQPDKYRAFEEMAVRSSDAGTDIKLHDRMCENKHIPDFLLCLQAWLWNNQGDPRSTRRPWRLGCLDLSRNQLSNDSISKVVDMLKAVDVRVERLWLAGNALEASGMSLIIEYIWNCLDPLTELNVADNEVVADGAAGSDVVSDLLRCLYNHSSYPRIVSEKENGRGSSSMKVVPLTVHMGGNLVRDPKKLLHDIQAGRKQHVQIRQSADPYRYKGEEFLAVFLPKFLEQNTKNGKTASAIVDKRRESKEGKDKRRHKVAKEPEAPARSRRRRRSRSGRGHDKPKAASGGNATEQKPSVVLTPAPAVGGRSEKAARSPAGRGEPEHWRPASSERSSEGSVSRSPPSDGRRRGATEVTEPASAPAAVDSSPPADAESTWVAPALDDAEREALQQAVKDQMKGFSFLDDEEGTRAMLSEFVVCMAVTGKSPKEMESELESFFAGHTHQFVKWFVDYVQQQKKKSADPQ
mmetsp:Transcript_44329/g.77831  ORF Transcript_44329/g.77831 Transcript_44329/m.77831 type:complete len:581 (+) Transcript_44329:197-1939(+)